MCWLLAIFQSFFFFPFGKVVQLCKLIEKDNNSPTLHHSCSLTFVWTSNPTSKSLNSKLWMFRTGVTCVAFNSVMLKVRTSNIIASESSKVLTIEDTYKQPTTPNPHMETVPPNTTIDPTATNPLMETETHIITTDPTTTNYIYGNLIKILCSNFLYNISLFSMFSCVFLLHICTYTIYNGRLSCMFSRDVRYLYKQLESNCLYYIKSYVRVQESLPLIMAFISVSVNNFVTLKLNQGNYPIMEGATFGLSRPSRPPH